MPNNIFFAKLAKPGVGGGSRVYYPETVLREYGTKAFTKGIKILDTHIFNNFDHPAHTQGVSLNDVIGVLIEDSVYLDEYIDDDNVDHGPGIYAKVKIYKEFLDRWADKIEDGLLKLSMSVFAATDEENPMVIDGREYPVVTFILADPKNTTVDGVVYEGLEGSGVLHPLKENLTLMLPQPNQQGAEIKKGDKNMPIEEQLAEALSRIETLEGELANRDAALREASEAQRKVIEENTITNLIGGVKFISEKARTLVTNDVLSQMKWTDGVLNIEELTAATEAYRNGTDAMVRAEVKETERFSKTSSFYQNYQMPVFNVSESATSEGSQAGVNLLDQLKEATK